MEHKPETTTFSIGTTEARLIDHTDPWGGHYELLLFDDPHEWAYAELKFSSTHGFRTAVRALNELLEREPVRAWGRAPQ